MTKRKSEPKATEDEYVTPLQGEARDAVARASLKAASLIAKETNERAARVEISVAQIRDVLHADFGKVKGSTFRSAVRKCKAIEPVRRGIYRLRTTG